MDFDCNCYLENYPDLVKAGIKTEEQALSHYEKFGKSEGRSFLPNFIKTRDSFGELLLIHLVGDYISKINSVQMIYNINITNLGINLYEGQKTFSSTLVLDNLNIDSIFDTPEVLKEKNISIHGHFKTKKVAEYIQSFVDKNRVKINKKNPYINPPGDLFVHVYFGDHHHANYMESYDYYAHAISKVPSFTKGYICSDNITHIICKTLIMRYSLTILTLKDPIQIIQLGSIFKNIVLSRNTFSWFLGVFSENSNVYFPERPCKKNIHGNLFVFKTWNRIVY